MDTDDSENTTVLTESQLNQMIDSEEANFEAGFIENVGTASSSYKRPNDNGKTQLLPKVTVRP